jgi:TRAP-type mannitol/chloroaromatic compound transport system permease large subunit
MTPTEAGIYGFVALVALMFLKIPVGFVMARVGLLGFAALVSWDAALHLMAQDFFSIFGSYNLTVIPLFLLMGQVAYYTGISSRLFNAAHKFLGHLPGGLAVASVGAARGSRPSAAHERHGRHDGRVALPKMKKSTTTRLATGVVARRAARDPHPTSTIFIVTGS